MNYLLDAIAAFVIIYVAAWMFLVLRTQCQRRHRINTRERMVCTITAGVVSFAFAAFMIWAVVL